MKPRCLSVILLAALCVVATSLGLADEPANGWRGNATGLWPAAQVPTEWYRVPRGAMRDLRSQASRPETTKAGQASLVEKGLLRDWLVVGPFVVNDSAKEFDRDLLDGEATVEPSTGDPVGMLKWQAATVPPDDPMVFGTAELPWLDVGKLVGFKTNQIAYAHTYVHSPLGGRARIVVDHGQGLAAWVNGRRVYHQPDRGIGLGFYTAISRHELSHLTQSSPRFDVVLNPGWNRLLLKLSTPNRPGHTDMRCSLRIMDPPDVQYDSKNIRWMTELPARSTSTPILVEDRLFVMAEPDELLCIDKNSGRILWKAANNPYEMLTPSDRAANPAFSTQVDPLVTELQKTNDRTRRIELRRAIEQTLIKIDESRFKLPLDGHFDSHFGIVGFTMPTPVSDGQHVFVWCGNGMAACYDLKGSRHWITRVPVESIQYGSSPALADGVLAVFMNKLYGLDAATGKLLWTQHRVRKNVASLLAARLAGQNVFISQQGEIIQPRDGHLLFRPRGIGTGDTGWSPPVVLENVLHVPRYGVAQLTLFDFADCSGDLWKPKTIATIQLSSTINRGEGGRWIDRWTAGSPLIWQGLSYQVDIYGTLYTVELKSGSLLYRQPLEIEGLMHYNAVPVAASPTLIGKHIFATDNQGTTLVIEPGRKFQQVARNRIATQLDRRWPIPAQEILTYAPPITDGTRLYLRGERYLYCIGTEQSQ